MRVILACAFSGTYLMYSAPTFLRVETTPPGEVPDPDTFNCLGSRRNVNTLTASKPGIYHSLLGKGHSRLYCGLIFPRSGARQLHV
jgi:hypothetical protein